MKLQIWFDDAKANGSVPFDEPFDPAMIASDGSGRKWPYWLSAEANVKINRFLKDQAGAKAWVSLNGDDKDGNLHSFEYLRVGDGVLFVKTAARNQSTNLPVFDMLHEVSHCEMSEQLTRYLQGEQRLIPIREFKRIHDRICERYNMRLGGWSGSGLEIVTE